MSERSRSEAGAANRKAFNRARQRARHRTAMSFHGELVGRLSDITGGERRATSGERQIAIRAIVAEHRDIYDGFMAEQLTREPHIDIPRGTPVRYPHGTEVARDRHVRRGEDPDACDECRQWYETTHAHVCRVCEQPFIRAGQAQYCSQPCYQLSLYLRYWIRTTTRKYKTREAPLASAVKARAWAEQAGVDLDALVARFKAS